MISIEFQQTSGTSKKVRLGTTELAEQFFRNPENWGHHMEGELQSAVSNSISMLMDSIRKAHENIIQKVSGESVSVRTGISGLSINVSPN